MSASGVDVEVWWQDELLAWEHVADGARPSPAVEALTATLDDSAAPSDGSWAAHDLGPLSVHVRRAPRPRYRDVARPLDRGLAWGISGAMVLGIAFLFMVGFVPPAGSSLSVERLDDADPLLGYLYAPPAEPVVPRIIRHRDGTGPIAEGPARPMALDTGVSGAADSPRTRSGQIRFRGEREVTQRVPRAEADLRSAGVLGVLQALGEASTAGALAGDAEAEGWTPDDAYGRALAEVVGIGHGSGGFDMIGTGRGGCRPGDESCAEGTVGLDGAGLGWGGVGYGTTCGVDTCDALGRAFGRGTAFGLRSAGRVERRQAGRGSDLPPELRGARREAADGLTQDQIQRVVRHHRPQIRHCYEGSLAAKSGQAGHVEVGIIITESGEVLDSDVSTDTLSDRDVTSCITRVVRRMRFPSAEARTDATLPFGLDVFGG